MNDAQQRALKQLRTGISESVAMLADETLVGCDGDWETYNVWAEELHNAVDDGLEEAERRGGEYDD